MCFDVRVSLALNHFLFRSNLVPSVAEFMYLDKVKWLEMYGVDLHPVKVWHFSLNAILFYCHASKI